MSRKAIFQGEFHTSKSDRESLESKITTDIDALFIEKREDRVSPENWSIGYLSFIVGTFQIFWIQDVLSRAPNNPEYSIPVYDEIDIPLPDLYSVFPMKWRLVSGAFGVSIFLIGVFVPQFGIPFIEPPLAVLNVYNLFAKSVTVAAAPLFYSFLLIYSEQRWMGERDKEMADNIDQCSREEGYNRVVISCGDAHLKRLPSLLGDKGWNVEINQSNLGLLSRFWRWLIGD